MLCLTSSEIKKWLTGQGMHHQPMAAGVPIAGEYPLPIDRRSRSQFGSNLADLLAKDGNKLIEIIPPHDSPSREVDELLQYRSAISETRPITKVPGHLFKSRDREAFRQILPIILGLPSEWGVYLYSAPSHTTLLLNQQVNIWSIKRGLRNELSRWLSEPKAA